MYKDSRPVQTDPATASTPEMWARMFAASTRMNRWRMLRFKRTREWQLVRRYAPAGTSILDAGCGFGEWVCFLASQGYAAQGLDYSTELIARLHTTYPQLTWRTGDVRSMPYEDGAFDAVISWGVIEHDEAGPVAALREFLRVLKPGGVAIVTVPIDSSAQRRSADYLYHRGPAAQTFFQYFMTAQDLSSSLTEAGFAVVEQGVLPNAVLQLVSPRLASRLRGVPFRVINLFVSTCMSWMHRYCVMQYCAAAKPGPASERSVDNVLV